MYSGVLQRAWNKLIKLWWPTNEHLHTFTVNNLCNKCIIKLSLNYIEIFSGFETLHSKRELESVWNSLCFASLDKLLTHLKTNEIIKLSKACNNMKPESVFEDICSRRWIDYTFQQEVKQVQEWEYSSTSSKDIVEASGFVSQPKARTLKKSK